MKTQILHRRYIRNKDPTEEIGVVAGSSTTAQVKMGRLVRVERKLASSTPLADLVEVGLEDSSVVDVELRPPGCYIIYKEG